MRVIGLDIGGANVKASDGESLSVSEPFALWREPERLSRVLAGVLRDFASFDALAVTMTGELADCFSCKADGVQHILHAVELVSNSRPIHVWQTGGEFVTPAEARELVPLVASANWHALATWAGRVVPRGAALLIDCGSTTTDLIPIVDGIPTPNGRTDLERLLSGELVYSGVRRTPVCAMASAVPFRGRRCPLAAELFATALDVYLWLGDIPEALEDSNTADGRPATRAAARVRLARMLCCDGREFSGDDADTVARFLSQAQRHGLESALNRVLEQIGQPCGVALITGEGEFLLRRLIAPVSRLADAEVVSLEQALGTMHSRAACGFAVSRMLRERSQRTSAISVLN